ncbi:TBC-domain-containing protein, partial [Rhizodiscina lignyota]
GSVIGFASIGLSGRGAKAKRKELHRLILQGIPVELRSKVWGECMRSQVQGDPEYYHALLSTPEYATPADAVVRESIDADVQRTLKDNVYFRNPDGPGTHKLTDVLVALARRNPRVGYCQGMNLIAGSLLLVLPTAEEAFWVMVFLTEKILPDGYMGDALLTSRADAKVLRRYVSEQMPALAAFFDRQDVWLEFEVLAISWFVSAFTAVFCGEALYRVWDVVFCWRDGDIFMLCVALALLKLNEKALLACPGRTEVSGYLNARMTDHAISIDGVVRAANALRKVVRRDDVEHKRKEELDGLQ